MDKKITYSEHLKNNSKDYIKHESFDSNYIIISVILILILLVLCGCFYYFYNESVDNNTTYFNCPPGQCATNIYNGEKRCPQENIDQVYYDASFEVCNSKYTCESNRTPYALLASGATNPQGVCDAGNICRCLNTSQCATDIVSTFKMTNGNINIDKNSTFNQIPLNIQGDDGSQVFSIEDPNITFCAIKANHLNRLTPNACSFADDKNIKINEIVKCMSDNPCLVGALAFYPNNADNFVLNSTNLNAIYNVPVACVPASQPRYSYYTINGLKNLCNNNAVPVWNKKLGIIQCKPV